MTKEEKWIEDNKYLWLSGDYFLVGKERGHYTIAGRNRSLLILEEDDEWLFVIDKMLEHGATVVEDLADYTNYMDWKDIPDNTWRPNIEELDRQKREREE